MSPNPNYDASLADRRLDAKVEQYDMITAVTQRAINNQFDAMYKVEPTLQKLTVTAPKNSSHVTMQVDLGPPKAALRLGTNNKIVLFYLTLKDGWFEWFNQETYQLQTTKIKDWVIAFDVNLDMKQMEDGSIPPRIVEALRKHGVGQAGNYSVKQLLIDFTTARLSNYNAKESYLPALEEDAGSAGEIASIRVGFETYIKLYLETIKLSKDGSGTTIAFVPEFTDPTVYPAPSIPPTALRFQNYPFRAKSGGQNVEGRDQGNNMLLYLEMTNKRALPEQALNTSENWVVPGPDNRLVDGCVALSKKIFLDEWLIPKLTRLNEITYIAADTVDFTEGGVYEKVAYNWTRAQDVDYSFKFEHIKDNEAVYSFKHPSSKEDKRGIKGAEIAGVVLTASVENYVRIPLAPSNGECVIKISGTSKAEVEYWGPNLLYVDAWGSMTWNAAFKFTAVDNDGGLEVVMDPPIPEKPKVSSDKKGLDLTFGDDPKDVIATTMSDFDTTSVLNDMNKLFKGTWAFYFAGAGDFFFKNPIFNREGDLMLELQYKGV